MPSPIHYKTPDLLFTSGDLRNAAWAGWHAALGHADAAEACREKAGQEEIIVEMAKRNINDLRGQLAAANRRIADLERGERDH